MWTSINKKYLIFLSIIFIIGIASGIIYLNILNGDAKNIIMTSINNFLLNTQSIKINYLLIHLLIISFLIITSLLVIGLPISLFYLFYNGFLLGFIISCITTIKGFKGFLYSLIYIFITKGVYLFFLFLLVLFLTKLSLTILKKNNLKKERIFNLSKKSLICLIIVFVNDLILYFWGNQIINIFNFLIN